MRIVIAAIAACVLALATTAPAASPACLVPAFTYRHGVVTFSERGDVNRVDVEIAETPDEQEVGLMCREALAPNSGMLFAFTATVQDSFWMKNTLIPLSIAFIDADWHIVTLLDMPVAPDPHNGPFPFYTPTGPYRYALEVNEGFFAHHDITSAAQVTFQPLGDTH